MDELTLAQRIAVWALPLIFAVTVHEAAHGWVADRLGDPTAREMGRITLNPIPHIDLIGTLLVPLLMLTFTGFLIGWAKPVPVSVRRLHSPKRDMAIVAAAGPAVNLAMALGWSVVLLIAHSLVHTQQFLALPLLLMAVAGLFINIVLMAINLLPVPPLDGGRILTGLLPRPAAGGGSPARPRAFGAAADARSPGRAGRTANLLQPPGGHASHPGAFGLVRLPAYPATRPRHR